MPILILINAQYLQVLVLSFEWSLLLRFSSTHKTIPLPLAKFIIPHSPLTVMLFQKTLGAFQSWGPT